MRRRKKDGEKKKKKVCSHNRETVQSGVGRTDSFIKNFATNMSYQQESLESAAPTCWLSSSGPSRGCLSSVTHHAAIPDAFLRTTFWKFSLSYSLE